MLGYRLANDLDSAGQRQSAVGKPGIEQWNRPHYPQFHHQIQSGCLELQVVWLKREVERIGRVRAAVHSVAFEPHRVQHAQSDPADPAPHFGVQVQRRTGAGGPVRTRARLRLDPAPRLPTLPQRQVVRLTRQVQVTLQTHLARQVQGRQAGHRTQSARRQELLQSYDWLFEELPRRQRRWSLTEGCVEVYLHHTWYEHTSQAQYWRQLIPTEVIWIDSFQWEFGLENVVHD